MQGLGQCLCVHIEGGIAMNHSFSSLRCLIRISVPGLFRVVYWAGNTGRTAARCRPQEAHAHWLTGWHAHRVTGWHAHQVTGWHAHRVTGWHRGSAGPDTVPDPLVPPAGLPVVRPAALPPTSRRCRKPRLFGLPLRGCAPSSAGRFLNVAWFAWPFSIDYGTDMSTQSELRSVGLTR